jgi:hypothetical protein
MTAMTCDDGDLCRLLTGVGMPFAEKPAQDEGYDTNLSFAGGHAAKGEPK